MRPTATARPWSLELSALTARSSACPEGLCACEEAAEVYASCRMPCEGLADLPKAESSTTSTTSAPKASRLLFYDTRYGADFASQLEVFQVAKELARRLNASGAHENADC